MIGERRNAGLTQDDGVVELLKCGKRALEAECSRKKYAAGDVHSCTPNTYITSK